jgi:NAD-dependent protein deacetylase/lipoamidase
MTADVLDVPQGLVEALRNAQHVVVLTGSGISAESGVPTFRDAQSGLWAQYEPTELATPEAFARDPKLVWSWYQWRRELVAAARPNSGHHALVALAARVPKLTLVTQNVDGLHQRAGNSSVIEYHGNLFRDLCSTRCGAPAGPAANDAEPPHCGTCGALMRPGVVWFGESIPPDAVAAADAACAECEVFLSVGTSSLVWPAAGLADLAAANGAIVAEINPEETPLSPSVRYRLAAGAGLALPKLVDLLAASQPQV